MPISSTTGDDDAPCVGMYHSTHRRKSAGPSGRALRSVHVTCVRQVQSALFYPWLIERISQTFFQEWIGAWNVPTKIDHAEWLCTMCGEYTATWETRSGSYCRYCWSLGRTSPLGPVPAYLKELIPHDEV